MRSGVGLETRDSASDSFKLLKMNGKMIGAILSGACALVVDPGLRRLQKAVGLPEPRQEVTVTEFWMTASLTADFPPAPT